MNRSRLPRAGRIAAGGLLVASLIGLSHLTARAAAATDCVTYYCATLTVAVTGDGFTRLVDDQGEIDCYYSGGGPATGACHVQYYWIGQLSSTLTVTITSTAQPNSWVCTYFGTYICSELGGSRTFSVTLSRDEAAYRESEAHLAHSLTTSINASGDGDGRVTSNPAGIDCVVAAGATSGTCHATWYFKSTLTLTLTGTAAKGDYACLFAVCHAVGVPIQSDPYTYTGSATNAWSFSFWHGHPILTVAVVGPGSVTSSPAGINCPSACSQYFAADTLVSLSATPPAGYGLNWSGACTGTATICNVPLGTTDASVTATFAKLFTPAPTPHPTATPVATPSSRPSIVPTATQSATPTAGVPATSPNASTDEQPSTPVPGAGASQAVAVGATPGADSTSRPSGPNSSGDRVATNPQTTIEGAGSDTVPIAALLILVATIALGAGLALGRRSRSATPPPA